MLQAKENTKQARLVLVDLAQSMILDTCSLLGVLCPDKMQMGDRQIRSSMI
ncbi:MAG: hypothetical protein LBS02_00615 [Hungatella sp.]|nr:hypothetical protein [Hungatella sp.]